VLVIKKSKPHGDGLFWQAGYSVYENRDNGKVVSAEEQKTWNVKHEPKVDKK
jgi:hypothetical protein